MEGWLRAALVVGASVLFGFGTWFGYLDKNQSQALSYGAGAIVLVFAFLSQFKRFEGPFGVKGEMWEKEMEEAQEIARNLRGLAAVVAKPIVSSLVRMGRIGTEATRTEMAEIAANVTRMLRESGVSEDEISSALADYRKVTMFDMSATARDAVDKALKAKVKVKRDRLDALGNHITVEMKDKHDSLHAAVREAGNEARAIMERIGIKGVLRFPEIVTEELNRCSLLSPEERSALLEEIQPEIEDIRVFREDGTIRRPDVWFSGGPDFQ